MDITLNLIYKNGVLVTGTQVFNSDAINFNSMSSSISGTYFNYMEYIDFVATSGRWCVSQTPAQIQFLIAAKIKVSLHPAAATLTTIQTLATVSALTQLDEIIAANTGGADDVIRVLINSTGGADTNAMYILYDIPVRAGSTYSADFRDKFPSGTVFKVYSLNGNISFTILSHTLI